MRGTAGIEAVVWDVDGTLIDSEPLHERALLDVCRRHRVDLAGVDTRSFSGVHMPDVWAMIGHLFPLPLNREAWLAEIEAAYVADAGTLPPVPGAVEAVRALHRAGVAQACVSNSSRIVVDANLAALGIASCFAFTTSLDDVREGKPAPEPYRRACDLLGCRPGRALAVEDSVTGLRSARAAGLRTGGYLPSATAEPPPGFLDVADVVLRDLALVPGLLGLPATVVEPVG